jgi:hypothetical protein
MLMKNKTASISHVLAIGLIFFFTGCQSPSQNDILRHIVVFKYKATATEEQILEVNREFRALKDRIPGITDFEYGVNDSPEGLDQGFTHVYMLTFESPEARDRYLPHPKHVEFGEFLGGMDILEDVFVVDYIPRGHNRKTHTENNL